MTDEEIIAKAKELGLVEPDKNNDMSTKLDATTELLEETKKMNETLMSEITEVKKTNMKLALQLETGDKKQSSEEILNEMF